MTEKARFKKAVGAALRTAGFAGKGQSWYLEGQDSVVMLNLQKSDHDEKYYVNFGIWLKSLGSASYPAENRCHIQSRLTSLFPEEVETIEKGCTMGDDEHLANFADLLEGKVASFCRECLRLGELRAKIEKGVFKKALVTREAMNALGEDL